METKQKYLNIKVNTYLNFNGNTEEVFNFYKSVFGGKFLTLQRLKDTPKEVQKNIPKKELNKIMHISLPIGKNHILMGTEAPESMGFKIIKGNNQYISLEVTSKKEADEIYKKLQKMEKLKWHFKMHFGALIMLVLEINLKFNG